MCTVSFIPKPEGYILTSNRDETRSRNARQLVTDNLEEDVHIFYPKDTQHGGTWLAATNRGDLVCILNGAFVPYDRSVHYPVSRGRLPEFLLRAKAVSQLERLFPLKDVAPFTMVYHDGIELQELRFDGKHLHHTIMDKNQPHIWSSVTLYPEPVRQQRISHFRDFLHKHLTPDADALMKFHSSQPFGDGENDFIMNRSGIVETVSITQVVVNNDLVEMRHEDLIGSEIHQVSYNRTAH